MRTSAHARLAWETAIVTGAGQGPGSAIARRVLLASDEPRYVTGSTLVVDGGLLAQQRSAQDDTFPLSRFPAIGRLADPR